MRHIGMVERLWVLFCTTLTVALLVVDLFVRHGW